MSGRQKIESTNIATEPRSPGLSDMT